LSTGKMKEYRPVFDHQTSIFNSRFVLFMVLMFFFISLINYQSDMTILTLIIMGIFLTTSAWGRFAARNMEVRMKVDKSRVFPGEEIRIEVKAANNKLLPVWLKVEPDFSRSFIVSQRPASESCFLLWFQKTSFTWTLRSIRRGCFQIGRSNITVSDLFGFFPQQRIWEDTADIIVYPEISAIRPFSFPEQKFFSIPGAQSPVLDPIYIIGTRDYQPSTPARLIQWKTSARLCRLQEKVCEPSIQGKILFVFDTTLYCKGNREEAFEKMLAAIASMAVNLENSGNAVGFMTNARIAGGKSGFVPLSRNRSSLPMILETIARVQIEPESDFPDVFHQHINRLWGITCVLCSYTMDASILEMKAFYTARQIPVKYFVSSMEAGKEDLPFSPGSAQQIDSICL
jgi:uncharacterized protein (DUF58 family)